MTGSGGPVLLRETTSLRSWMALHRSCSGHTTHDRHAGAWSAPFLLHCRLITPQRA